MSVERPSDVLTPDSKHRWANACLSYSRDGFTFEQPGRYAIQAIYPSRSGYLYSNILPLFVRYPSRDDETRIVPLLNSEVATYFAVGGSWHLPRAMELLEEFAAHHHPGRKLESNTPDHSGTHPLAYAFWKCEALKHARGNVIVDRAARTVTQARTPPLTSKQLCMALGITDNDRLPVRSDVNAPARPRKAKEGPTSPFSNIVNGKLFTMLIDHYSATRQTKRRQKAINLATAYLRAQQVSPSIQDRYMSRWNPDGNSSGNVDPIA
jgi:hypothetical protein